MLVMLQHAYDFGHKGHTCWDVTYHAPLVQVVHVMNPLQLHVASEAFVQPDVVPPARCHQVTKPLRNMRSTNQQRLRMYLISYMYERMYILVVYP